jgi:glycosyltransferase involved in cell wall biosynthesis
MTEILFIIPTLGVGGTERQLVELAAGLAKINKYNISVFSLYGEGPIKAELLKYVQNFYNAGLSSIYNFLGIFRLSRKIKAGRFQIVHTFLFDANFYGALAAKLANTPVIITSRRDMDVWKTKRHIALERIANKFAQKIVTNSATVKEFIIHQEKLDKDRIVTIYNGIGADRYKNQYDKESLKNRFNMAKKNRVISLIGTLSHKKGQLVFLSAARNILTRFKGIEFLIVGEGPLKEELKNKAKELGIESSVRFLGLQQDIPAILSLTDIFVLPSLYESLPNAILEAMAAGLAVVATDVGGVAEAVEDKQSGFLVEPKNSQAIADAIIKLLENEELRQAMGQRGREIVKKKFGLEKMISDYDNLYTSLLSQS